MTAAITLLPILIYTGGSLPPVIMQSPVYHFFVVVVFGYSMAPVIADFTGNHIGKSLFHPNRANMDTPTMSHIISLRNKRLYKEATEELRMLNERYPEEIEPYKMLLHLCAHELPDRSLFDLTYRKGVRNLSNEDQKSVLKRYRDDHIQHKENAEEEWAETSHVEQDVIESKEFSANRAHHREIGKHTLHESRHVVEVAKGDAIDGKKREGRAIHSEANISPLGTLSDPADEKNFGASRKHLEKRSIDKAPSYRFVRKRSSRNSSIHTPKS